MRRKGGLKMNLEDIKKSHATHLNRKDGTAMISVWELKWMVEEIERLELALKASHHMIQELQYGE